MQDRFELELKFKNPTTIGVGLIALDVVINGRNEKHPHLWAGGSCGNVMTILAYLGWSSYPIAYIGNDFASKIVLQDMKKWGVKTDFIINNETVSTPIVVERINHNETKSSHVFEFKCPYCGSPLPRSRPLPRKIAMKITTKLPISKVFYFDRVSRTAIKFAKEQRSCGALVVFEPHTVSKERLFKESLEIAHIVKYSSDQIDKVELKHNVQLEIQTLGFKGLRYRFRKQIDRKHRWKTMRAFKPSKLVDTAGAGDWCTAGIIHVLGQSGFEQFSQATEEDIENALRIGQGLAALNCTQEGARGLMYNNNKSDLDSMFGNLSDQKEPRERGSSSLLESERNLLERLCPSCKVAERTRSAKRSDPRSSYNVIE